MCVRGSDAVSRWWVAAACITLGAATNVIVAWWYSRTCQGLAATEYIPIKSASDSAWPSSVPLGWPPPEITQRAACLGAELWVTASDTRGSYEAFQLYAGFPFRSFQAVRFVPEPTILPVQSGLRFRSLSEGLDLIYRDRWGSWCTTWLPIRPVWVGLVGNTLVHGALLWLGLAGVKRYRHFRRNRTGRCPCCAYDMRGLEGACPECGNE